MVTSRHLRVPQPTIDRIRAIARQRSEVTVTDVPWSVVGRELLEKALADHERRPATSSHPAAPR